MSVYDYMARSVRLEVIRIISFLGIGLSSFAKIDPQIFKMDKNIGQMNQAWSQTALFEPSRI